MSKRLFNDNGGETLTPEGHLWIENVADILRPLMAKAVAEGVSIRVLTAANLIRKDIEERRKNRNPVDFL
jgi:hypothetical protein